MSNDVKSFPYLHGERLETIIGWVCSKVQTRGTCIQNIVRNWKQSVPGTQGIFKIKSQLSTNKMDEICYEAEVKYEQNLQILMNPQHLARIMLLEQSASQWIFGTDLFFFSNMWKSVFWGFWWPNLRDALVQCFEHPKRDLALNDDKFLEPVQKM